MKVDSSSQIFERPKTSLRLQLKLWKELGLAVKAVNSPLASLSFREPSNARGFIVGILGTVAALSLGVYATAGVRAKQDRAPQRPRVKLATKIQAPKAPPHLPEPVAEPKPKAPPKTKSISKAPSREPKPPRRTAKAGAKTQAPLVPASSPETLDFSGQSGGVIESQGSARRGSGRATGRASGRGSPGGRGDSGSGPGSRATPAKVASSAPWNCAWPDAALDQASNRARVLLEIKVDKRGKMMRAKVLQSPGYGFGQEALACAKRQRYTPAKDPQGRAMSGGSIKVRVNFEHKE